MIPQSNAVLVAVEGEGTTDEWLPPDEEPGKGPDGPRLWEGGERCYYQERRDRSRGEAQELLVRRSLLVPEGAGPREWRAGQRVTFRLDGEATDSDGTVQNVERRRLPAAGSAQTTRLTLEDR